MRLGDQLIILVYLAVVFGIGGWLGRGQKNAKDFFLASRRMTWIPIGLSVMASLFSAISYVSYTGEVYAHGLWVLMSVPAFLIILPIVRNIFIPFYHKMEVYTAYEFLEKRFDVKVRYLVSGFFILWRIVWMALAIYTPCKVLTVVTGYPLVSIVLAAGIITTAYTALGGMRAVIWTDVIQFFVLFGGMAVGVAVASHDLAGGFLDIFRLAARGGRLQPFYPGDASALSLTLNQRITFWTIVSGTFVSMLSFYVADQVTVQRYFTARSLRDARTSFTLNIVCVMIVLLALAVLGLGVYAYFETHAKPSADFDAEQFFSAFIASFPAGLCGVLIAAFYAATMSSIDSGINSCSTVVLVDFIQTFRRRTNRAPIGEGQTLVYARALTIAFGVLVTILACFMGRLGTVFETTNKVVNGLGGPLLAIFIAGIFSRRATTEGVLLGGVIGGAISAFACFRLKVPAVYINPVFNFAVTYALCMIFSFFDERPSESQLAWTWKARRKA